MSFNEHALSVTQLNDYVKILIDSDEILQTAAVCGEISNFKNHYATGHLYFTLKDEKSTVKCVMFARDASRLTFEPENGMTVTVWGRVSVFSRDGVYQLYAGFMSPLGAGDQFTAFEILKKKLHEEGLFDQSKKKPIPKYPTRIGVVTSATGAAVRDVLNILGRRWPVAQVELYPALVQGSGAPKSLCNGIDYFVRKRTVDVIIIGRGGGSGEDLSAFNDESLARKIALCDIPVISAVGHETDVSISDFVADLRAPTPSAAAELAVPNKYEYMERIVALLGRARGILSQRIDHAEMLLDNYSKTRVLSDPFQNIEIRENDILYLAQMLDATYGNIIAKSESCFGSAVSKLNALNPLEVLSRGYSIIEMNDTVVSSAQALSYGDKISLLFADGKVDAQVIK